MACSIKNICVIGAGAYGSALSEVFAENLNVTMLSLSYETMDSINNHHVNPKCLRDIKLRKNITCKCDYSCCENTDAIFIVTPVSAVRTVCQNIIDNSVSSYVPVIMCSKGIEIETGLFTTEIAQEVGVKNPLFVLSGPSFAEEIANGLYASVSLAGNDHACNLARELSTKTFKIISNNDIIGTQICGAMKNVLAVLCGAFVGAEFGRSAISMLITAAVHEIGDLIEHAGGQRQTVYDMCGIGDIILTCTNDASRNMKFGRFLANGGTISEWTGALAEGAFTAKAIPIIEQRFISLNVLRNAYELIYCRKSMNDIICDITKMLR